MRIQIFTVLVAVALLLVIFQLVRKNKLLEQYSLLWIASAVLLIVLALWRDLQTWMSNLIGIYYPPSALFLIAIVCGMVIALHFSVVISNLREQNHLLAQEMALLKEKIEKLNSES